MTQGRTANASRNIVFGTILKTYQILMPFVIRTIIIYCLGMEYAGLNGLFTSILQVLNLAELGVGSAMVFSMYKPIAENDHKTICALIKLYKFYYRIIGLVILAVGLVILPFVPKLINGTVPGGLNVYVLYLLNLAATVFSYWLFAYKNSLLVAYQRSDIISKLQIISSTVQYTAQVAVILIFKNYYLFLCIAFLTQILNNILIAKVSNKMYPSIQPVGKLDKNTVRQINQRVKDLFTAKVGGVVVNAADTIVLSAVLGLTALALYQNYLYIISAVIGFSTIIYKSVTASVGNSIVTDHSDKYFEDFRTISFFCFMIYGFCISCFLCLFQPFIKLWVGSENLLSLGMVVLFCVYFYSYELVQLFSLYKDGAGIWHQDRFRPLIEAASNLILNIILIHYFGLYGILIATIISMLFISMPWLYRNLFKYVFKRSAKQYTKLMLVSSLWIVLISAMDYLICMFIPESGIFMFILRALVCVAFAAVAFLLVFSRFKEFNAVLDLANRATGGRLKRLMNRFKKKGNL